jgi:SAM-dependent methyltransferase
MASADSHTLQVWEQAEIERSSGEAARTADGVRPTSPSILKRYASPPADTVYALEYAYHLAGDVRGRHVLDLGCGSGQNAAILAARGARVSAMDISPDLLGLAARRAQLDGLAPAITTLCGSAHAIPLPDASVDLVFGNAILHHLDLDLTSREVHRVLRPGGRAIFKEPMRNSRVIAFLRRLIPYRQPDISPFERPLRHDEIERFAARFSAWRGRSFDLPVVQLAAKVGLAPAALSWLRRWDRRLLDRSPTLGRLASVLVFEVRK